MWQSILYPPIFVRLIDTSLRFLFGWTAVNISAHQKLAAYPHLYSYTSTKSVVHWFQIIRNGVFQMYDDEAPSPITSNRSKYYKVAKFPTKNIKTPIVLVYGGSDSLVDIDVMLKELPRHTIAKEIPHYEHLDFLWAQSVNELVFPHVFEALEQHAGKDGNAKASRWRSPARFRGLLPGEEQNPEADEDESSSSPAAFRAKKVSQSTRRTHSGAVDSAATDEQSPSHMRSPRSSRLPQPRTHHTPPSARRQSAESAQNEHASPSASLNASQLTTQTSSSRPEGWWSSDDVAGTQPSTPTKMTTNNVNRSPSRASFDSQMSTGDGIVKARFGHKGIMITPGHAVSGVVEAQGTGVRSDAEKGIASGSGDSTKRKKRVGRRKGSASVDVET